MSFVRDFATGVHFDSIKAKELELAAEEILINIIKYAYPDTAGSIEVSCEHHDKSISITVVDEGVPFNILAAKMPNTSLPLEEREIGGMGIFLMRQFVDDITYTYTHGKNKVTLIKKECS